MTGRTKADGGSNAPAKDRPRKDSALERPIGNAELQLRSTLLDHLHDGLIAHTLNGHVVYANLRAAGMLGYSIEEFLLLPPWGWVLPEQRAHLAKRMNQLLAAGSVVFETRCFDTEGEVVCVEISSSVLDAAPWGPICVSVLRDSSVRIAQQETMHRLAFFDSLTGLGNRVMLEDRIQSAIATSRQHGDTVGLIYLDLDDFKPVNDTHGHAMGDRVLGIIGERLQSCVRETDTVARVGGDEFIVLFPRLSAHADLAAKARQLAECVSQPIVIGDVCVRVTASLGLAIHQPGEHKDDFICRADHAMYHAKVNGLAGWEDHLEAS